MAKLRPKMATMRPRMAKRRPKRARRRPKMAKTRPEIAKRRPKRTKRRPKMAKRRRTAGVIGARRHSQNRPQEPNSPCRPCGPHVFEQKSKSPCRPCGPHVFEHPWEITFLRFIPCTCNKIAPPWESKPFRRNFAPPIGGPRWPRAGVKSPNPSGGRAGPTFLKITKARNKIF